MMILEENKLLAPLTTFGIGGQARWFVEATSEDEVVEATSWARERGLPLFVLGGGSNLLVADAGFHGLVMRVALSGIDERDGNGNGVLFRAAASEDWDGLVRRATAADCAGVECLAGIPGTVGGTPVQNVGAYGQEVAQVIERVRAFDLREREFVEFETGECEFAYRKSRFNSTDRGRFVVTRVDYRLTIGGTPTLRYPDVERAFAEGARPSLEEVAEAVRQIRRAKGMLLVEGDPDCRSAGSFFKNPIVPREQVWRVRTAAGKEPPQFPARVEGKVKLAAAWLIEQAGFAKGYARGRAGISSRHTLALVNLGGARGGATASEVLALAGEITGAVEKKFGVTLVAEPVLLGF